MNNEIDLCLKQLAGIDNDCKDVMIAGWSEKDLIKRQLLETIYKEKCLKRKEIIDKLVKLTKKWKNQ